MVRLSPKERKQCVQEFEEMRARGKEIKENKLIGKERDIYWAVTVFKHFHMHYLKFIQPLCLVGHFCPQTSLKKEKWLSQGPYTAGIQSISCDLKSETPKEQKVLSSSYFCWSSLLLSVWPNLKKQTRRGQDWETDNQNYPVQQGWEVQPSWLLQGCRI